MLNQRKAYIENTNPIQGLVNFENTMRQLNVEQPVKVQLSRNGKSVQIIHNGVVLNGAVERPLIHQLGSRAWGKNHNFNVINALWQQKFANNRFELEQELAAVFSRHDLSIRYHTDRGQNQIYGIVTPHFVDVNQLEFRQNFMEQIRHTTALVPESRGIEISNHGQITEFFKFGTSNFQTKFQYGLVYAKNNGYEAYKVNWDRLIIICTNGLTRWEGGNQFSWKHTKEVDLAEFITNTVKDGMGNQKFLEERITASRDTALNQNWIQELMARLSLTQPSKERVSHRLAIESEQVGYNEWALSQSLTWLGSHEKAISFRNRQQLIDLGTDILEHSLDEVLEEESKLCYDGFYGLVLPKGFKRG
jgi:hypothetical protein